MYKLRELFLYIPSTHIYQPLDNNKFRNEDTFIYHIHAHETKHIVTLSLI